MADLSLFLLRATDLSTRAILAADKTASKLPCYRKTKGALLDIVLGSEDTTEYVSRTN